MLPGTTIGEFEILEKLGQGGMGEVYRARDTRLGREVAIKILPAAVAADAGRLERLAREARLLASLNHPNIATIHAVETAPSTGSGQAGDCALVLELVEGETLGARIRRKPLTIAEARAIARQIIAALDAAHECGIVHRDLKPENVMLGSRGLVKVLDFGLAKTAAPVDGDESPTVTVGPTAHGTIVGTAAYMSPEQARGLRVDRRTDIWAFGCVLYEMLTGRRAFPGATLSDTIVATLEKEPDWGALPRETPAAMRRLLTRTLQKDPHDRLRDIADAVADLDAPPARENASPRVTPGWIPWAVTALVVAASAWLVLWRFSTSNDAIAGSVLTPLTRDAGLTTSPALSRDGRLLAYSSDRAGGGTLDIWVQQVAGGTTIRLTDDEADDTAPDFSPDGSQILFQSDRGGGGAYLVSAFGGGAPPRLVARGARQPRFSPDGTRIAYWSGAWRGTASNIVSGLFVVSLAGGEPLRLAPVFRSVKAPVWAPDGRSLLVLGRSTDRAPLEESFDWWWIKLDGSAPVKVGLLSTAALRSADVQPSAWTGDEVLFSDSQDLWSVHVSQTNGRMLYPPRRLTVSAGAYTSPTIGSDGRIVFASTQNVRVIERATLDASADPRPPVQLYADFATDTGRPSETRDGTIIVFERYVPGGIEIWIRNVRTGLEQVITRVDSLSGLSATISPDGVRIAYTISDGSGAIGRGFVVETARGVPSQVCDKCVVGGFLSDGRRLLLSTGDSIRVHDVGSGTSLVAVTTQDGNVNRPHASPDDRWLAFRSSAIGPEGKSFVAPLTPGRPQPRESWMAIDEATGTGRPAGWSLDSRMVYLLLDTDGFRCLWGQQLDVAGRLDGTPVPVRHFHGADWAALSTSFGNAVSPDGFLYATMKSRGNIWSLTRPPR
ncbi:MAG TPA: protein kinase [Vicinamibacterales bacterium]|nr:protein kinase [Vicinamibacterales bacterium]